ncbi:MAG: hypothetical protein JO218_00490 [Burkholderiales bacterium]|nr:hypothetical protein [Burkholderiales bacterium]
MQDMIPRHSDAQWEITPTPAAEASSAYWFAGNVTYMNNGDGTCQGFTLQ